MEKTINPEALKKARKDRGLTQMQLAEKCGFSKESVSRWERGEIDNVRSRSREKLTKALGVDWEQLTRAPVDEDESEQLSTKVTLNVRIGGNARNALTLVCLRYGLNVADVIELAPLLFLVIAEKSLVHRREKLQEIRKRHREDDGEDREAAPHLNTEFTRGWIVESALVSEGDSISKRDIFGKHIELENYNGEDGEDLNPFLNYLRKFKEGIPDKLVTLDNWWDDISYTIAEDTLREVTGLEGKIDPEKNALALILNGNIDLREVLTSKKNLSPEDFQNWLQKQVDDDTEKYIKFFA